MGFIDAEASMNAAGNGRGKTKARKLAVSNSAQKTRFKNK
jgi:hypothetical protein